MIDRTLDYLENALNSLDNTHLSDVSNLEEMSELMKIRNEIYNTYTKLDNFKTEHDNN